MIFLSWDILNAEVLQLSDFSNFSLANKCIHCVWELHLLRGLRGIWIKSASIACGAASSSYAQMRRERDLPRQKWNHSDEESVILSQLFGKHQQKDTLWGLEGQLGYGQICIDWGQFYLFSLLKVHGKVRFLRKDEYVRSIIEEFGSVMNLGQKRWISLVFCIKYFLVWGIGKWRVHSSASSPKIYSSFIVGGQLWLATSPIIISWKSFQQTKGSEMPLHWLLIR